MAEPISFVLGALTAAASPILAQAQSIALGVMLGENYPAKLREMRRLSVNKIATSLKQRPASPSANHDLARALILAWCDVARAWLDDCEKLAKSELRGNDAAEMARFVQSARSYIAQLGGNAAKRSELLAHDPFHGCIDVVSRATSEVMAEPDWFAGVTRQIAEAARDDLVRAQLDPPQAALARLMTTKEEADQTIAVNGRTILDAFVEVLKSGAYPEATLAFHIHAAGAIRAELDTIRADVAAVAQDLATRVEGLATHVDWIAEAAGRIEGKLAEVTDALQRIEARMRQRMPLPLTLTLGTISELGFDRFSYMNPRIPFIGREGELGALHAFFTAESKELRWWALCGDGGVGKSRLALEYCQQLVRSGLADAGFLRRDGAIDWVALKSWQPERPTFIVMDYAASRADVVRDVLAALSDRSFEHQVRVLLIERIADERFVATVTGASQSEGAALRGKIYPTPGRLDPLSLMTPDDPDTLVQFGRNGWVLEARERPPVASLEPEPFLELLERADPGRRRPLVALVLGWRLALDENITANGLMELLDGWLASELIRWPAELFEAEPQALSTLRPEARRILVLATLLDGLSKEELKAQAPALAPDQAAVNRQWPAIRKVSGGDDGGLRSLAPDLLAEYFVLEARLPRSPADNPFGAEPSDDDLRRLAWTIRDGDAMRAFSFRAVRDLGMHPAAEGLAGLEEGNPAAYWLHFELRLAAGRSSGVSPDAVLSATVDDYLGRGDPAAWRASAEILHFRSSLDLDETSAAALYTRLLRLNLIGFPSRESRLVWAKSLFNYLHDRAADEPERAREMIDALHEAGADDREIRLEWASSITNFVNQCAAEEPLRAREMIAALHDAKADDREIRLEWAKSITNYVNRRAAEEPARARDMIGVLHDSGTEDREIRLEWAKSVTNYVGHRAAEEPERARDMIAALHDNGFEDREIQLQWAKSITNHIVDRAADEPDRALQFAWQQFGAAARLEDPEIGEAALRSAVVAASAGGFNSGRLLGLMTCVAPRLPLSKAGGVLAQHFLGLMLVMYSESTDAAFDAALGPVVHEVATRWAAGDPAFPEAFLWTSAQPKQAETWFALAATFLPTIIKGKQHSALMRLAGVLAAAGVWWHQRGLDPGDAALFFHRMLLASSADDPELTSVIAPLAEIPPWRHQQPLSEDEAAEPT
ncbi:MAG: hypothetical protein ACFE0R_17560 [Salinarimonas sp.]